MRLIIAFLALVAMTSSLAKNPSEEVSTADWTKEDVTEDSQGNFLYSERLLLYPDGSIRARAVNTITKDFPGFRAQIYDDGGKLRITEHYLMNAESGEIERVEVFNEQGELWYYVDASENVFLPDGTPSPPNAPDTQPFYEK